jgi:hypothetical protein
MVIESQNVEVNAPSEDVFTFLSNAKNIEELLPSDNIKDFQATETECSFKVQGGITITLIQESVEPFREIKMISGEKSPFPFHLTIHMGEDATKQTIGFIHFDGDVNPFLKMMVQKPLTNLFNYMSQKMKEKFD